MKMLMKVSLSVALAAGVSACGGAKQEDTAQTADTSAPAAAPAAADTAATTAVAANAAPAAFGICKSCHAVEKGKTVIGPSLFGIVGTKAGDVPGYSFSPALKASGLTWDDATLDKWLENPMKLVPGTRMTYAGQADAAKRKEIIDYLKTLK
ncbi:c-type cytochrome [Novosphingobium sp. KCTC 2891]|uniref:c-type cytochrome n=1 Tax=Novosphingobium sp. KCTC 2891 TaxID=2989730 RepID=UPI002223331E|nr:c-type cytochrome [Novosphingobium sp. KCTC 2891]MCW1382354.1 c-type cytochrome [Novosphingobium sp. KCTC 2891]